MKTIPSYDGGFSDRKKSTIGDVAQLAKVSVSTVSRVLNESPTVAPQTRARVLEAIQAMDYAPTASARGLRSGTSGVICFATVDFAPFYSEVVQGMAAVIEAHGYQLLLTPTWSVASREERALQLLSERRVDGLILADPHLPSKQLRKAVRSLGRIVLIGGRYSDVLADSISIANREAAFRATSHLLAHGYRDIGFIAGPLDEPDAQQRLAGFRDAIEEQGPAVGDAPVYPGRFTVEGGAEAFEYWRSQGHLPRAVFCGNDLSAIGFLRAARLSGLAIPDDVAVFGFDDVPEAQYVCPALSTVRQPAREMGAWAGQALIDLLGGASAVRHQVVLPAPLVFRESCGCRSNTMEQSAEVDGHAQSDVRRLVHEC